ncbi:MAG: hypothetical protein IT185_09630 [Acidobacteria bacterium]|jgi:hypothetical protein|nr:hypothetical protein [Acidobacteriota bacterium]
MLFRICRLRAHAARLIGALLLTLTASGCAQVDLKTVLEVQEMTSGYYDAGVTEGGLNKLVPSVTFRIKNVSAETVNSVDLMVFFWGVQYEQPMELDEVIITAIGSGGLAPGALTEPIVVRSKQGFSLEQPRAELFNHGQFRDTTAKLFMKRGGKIVPFGEFVTERRLLLAAPTDPASR